jgi:Fe-S cluster assembly protein SufD
MKAIKLDVNALPTPIQETWKYTNLSRAVPVGLVPEKDDEKTIHIPRGQVTGKPVEILWTGADKTLHNPRLKIVLEDQAELTLIERHEGQGTYWKNMSTEITIGAGARLDHIRIQNDAPESVHTTMTHITLARDGVYNGFSLNAGGKLSRHEMHAVLNGVNGECSFNGLNLLNGTQHGDTTILIEHAAPHGRSNQFYRTLLDGAARGVFQGKVHVHKIAQKTDGYQLSNAILLSDKAEMDTKPELEIYADDVKCSHGATTGQLDEAPLFYLRSRGLTDSEARLLLIRAFVDEVVDKIGDEAARAEIQVAVYGWLGKCLK